MQIKMSRARQLLIHTMAGFVVAIGALSIFGKLFDLDALGSWGKGAYISSPAAASLFITGIALWMLSGKKEET